MNGTISSARSQVCAHVRVCLCARMRIRVCLCVCAPPWWLTITEMIKQQWSAGNELELIVSVPTLCNYRFGPHHKVERCSPTYHKYFRLHDYSTNTFLFSWLIADCCVHVRDMTCSFHQIYALVFIAQPMWRGYEFSKYFDTTSPPSPTPLRTNTQHTHTHTQRLRQLLGSSWNYDVVSRRHVWHDVFN